MTEPRAADVVIVGAGVVGCAIARELARFELDVVLVDAGADVGAGTSKANTALLHTGFDAKPGTVEARLVARGHELLTAYAAETGIALEPTGALLVAWDESQRERLPSIAAQARANGYEDVRELGLDELHRREPRLGPGATGALEVPGEGVIDPWSPSIAYATQAVLAGCELRLRTRVTGARPLRDGSVLLATTRGELAARWVVNAAGLFSDELHRMLGHGGFTVTPRRGQLIVFDKLARPLVRHILLPVPTATTKGVLVAPTAFGNVLLGPTAEDLTDKADTASTADGLAALRAQGRRILPELVEHEVTAVYAGLRAATEHVDYQVTVHGAEGYACVGGIRSTGLTASMAIAEHVRGAMADAGLRLEERAGGLPAVRVPPLGEAMTRPYDDAARIARDADYGRLVCFCERVSRGEVRDALASPLPPRDLDGLRRRTRALNGRCQGFFCGGEVRALAAGLEGTA